MGAPAIKAVCGRPGPDTYGPTCCLRQPHHGRTEPCSTEILIGDIPVSVRWDYVNPATFDLPPGLAEGLRALGTFLLDLGCAVEFGGWDERFREVEA